MKAEMRIKIKLRKETEREKVAQDILFGYRDPYRWAVHNEDRKRKALERADVVIKNRGK